MEPNRKHFCDHKCPSCQYYVKFVLLYVFLTNHFSNTKHQTKQCELPFDHANKHSTTHGNMRNTVFVSEKEVCNFFYFFCLWCGFYKTKIVK